MTGSSAGNLRSGRAAEDPERDSLTQFMGGGVNIQPDATRAPIRPESGDRLLICSDGVYNAVNEQTLLQSLTLSAAAAAEDILGRVLAKGYANQDNLTAAVLEFREITHEPHADEPEASENSGGIAVKLHADCTYYTSAGGSDHNEDSVYCGRGIYAAADGLGGHSGGAAASQAAVNYIANAAKRSGGVLEVGMAELFEGANTAVRKLGGGLTTIAAGALREGKFILGNVGDSRVYYFRNGRVIAQTRDHSVCQAAVELGQLTPEQIRGSEDRVKLLKVLGNFDRAGAEAPARADTSNERRRISDMHRRFLGACPRTGDGVRPCKIRFPHRVARQNAETAASQDREQRR